jgi:hypothetical protein
VDHSGLEEWTLDGADSKFTFTRASTATYFDAIGIMQTALADELRIDYDPETGECLGTLIEEARTNLLTYSEDFSNVAWTKANSSVSANAVEAPDGETTADKLVEDGTAANTHVFTQTVSVSAETDYAFSVFAKKEELTLIQLVFGIGTINGNYYANFNLASGELGNNNFPAGSAIIEDCGNDWYRCSVIGTISSGESTANPFVVLLEADTASRFPTYDGDGTSGLYLWGAQLEAGAFPTSYIPTTTAAVTRNADVITMTGVNFSDWYNQSEGTVYIVENSASANGHRSVTLSDGTTDNRLTVGQHTSVGEYAISYMVVGGTGCSTMTTVVSDEQFNKIALSFDADGRNASINGAAVTTGTGTTPLPVDRIYIGSGYNGSVFGKIYIKQLQYYPRRLTNTQLQALSA